MVTVVTIRPDDTDALVALKGRIRDPSGILKKIGAIVESASLASFREQRLGTIEWPERYPNQGEPFVNIAGLLSDLNEGGNVKSRRLGESNRRPALIDKGDLKQSPKSRIVGDKMVETGVSGRAAEYAATHQHGLVSTLPVPLATKQKLAKLMLKGKPLSPYRSKLLFLLQPNRTSYDVDVVARPFLGVTDKASDEILDAVERHIATGATD